MTERLLLGLTGYSGTGKTTISKYLEDKGFVIEDGSALISRAASERGHVPSSRQEYEDAFRTEQKYRGLSWLSESILAREGSRIVQAGLRAKPDYLNLRKHNGLIIALICPIEVCLGRIDGSNPKNPKTPDEYREYQAIENNPDANGYGTHTGWCIENADYWVDTSQPLGATLNEIDVIVNE
jgi:shikimate kinase